ncbi:MAG TPA: hypothetical protein VGD34_13475 [Kribbella sp.]
MTSYPAEPVAPRRILTQLAIASFVIGLALAGFFVWRIVQTAPRSPEPIGGSAVHLDKEGLTIYSSRPVLSPTCEAKDPNGGNVPLSPISGSEMITINSNTWYVVVRSKSPVPPGDYAIRCTDNQTGTTYAAGPRSSVAGFVVSIFGLIGSLVVFFGLGVVLLIVAAVKRRRINRPPNIFPGGPPPTGAPGNTFPTFPPVPGTPPQQPYYPGPNPSAAPGPEDRSQGR